MNLDDLAVKAGFYTNGNEIFSPGVKERITDQLQEFMKLIENELVSDIAKEREPQNLNYSTNRSYTDAVKSTMRRLRV